MTSKVIVPPLTLSSPPKRVVVPCVKRRLSPPSLVLGVKVILPSAVNSIAVVALSVVVAVKV